ncbi:MAG: hypothetical protein DLM52_01240 [Chthoniobacterales bacterium]|nr:MAG: hypothetical protein DLM52_01240 [Chthoniobacterales bacterium]
MQLVPEGVALARHRSCGSFLASFLCAWLRLSCGAEAVSHCAATEDASRVSNRKVGIWKTRCVILLSLGCGLLRGGSAHIT